MARGLAESMEAAPVLSGGEPLVVEAGLEAVALLERVAEAMVELPPDEAEAEAEAAAEVMLATTDEAEARMLETAADAEEAAAEAADETAADPPLRPKRPE